MTSIRILLVAALAACAALVPAGTAVAGDSPVAKYRVTIQATQKTTWTKPLQVRDRDCFNRPWTKGSGGESVTMTGSGIIYAHRIGDFASFTYGSRAYGPGGQPGVPLRATASRSNNSLYGALPGPCGGGRPEERVPYTCDDAFGPYVGQLHFEGRRLALHTAPARGSFGMTWAHCPIDVAKGVTPGGITRISQVAPPREVFDPRSGKQIILASKKFREVLYPGVSNIETRTTTTWKITLTRLKK